MKTLSTVNIAGAALAILVLTASQAQSVNEPPSVTCPPTSTNECGSTVEATAQVLDPDGDAVTVVWSLNGVSVQTNTLAAGTTTTSTPVSLSGVFPLGTNSLAVTATDSLGDFTSCSTTVFVVDSTPPSVTNLKAIPARLWPVNNQMVNVLLQATVTDSCSSASWKIVSVTSNEPVLPPGPDWIITGDHTLKLRAQRLGSGTGRIYTITVKATDGAGNPSTKTVTVTVPHNLSGG